MPKRCLTDSADRLRVGKDGIQVELLQFTVAAGVLFFLLLASRACKIIHHQAVLFQRTDSLKSSWEQLRLTEFQSYFKDGLVS